MDGLNKNEWARLVAFREQVRFWTKELCELELQGTADRTYIFALNERLRDIEYRRIK